MKSERTQENTPGPALEKGQIWTLKDKCLEIQRVGKYLVELLVIQNDTGNAGQETLKTGKRLESIQAVQRFLQAHNAILSHR